jgi:glycosyltransferase involved in cell wall biosynthesis
MCRLLLVEKLASSGRKEHLSARILQLSSVRSESCILAALFDVEETIYRGQGTSACNKTVDRKAKETEVAIGARLGGKSAPVVQDQTQVIPKISLIIPTYNRGDVLCQTIAMALAQDYPDYEVIVVDQSDPVDAKVRSYIDSLGNCMQYHHLSFPNLPAARNAGARAASGEIIIFIDDDVVIGPEYVRCQARLYSDSSVGGVMGLTFDPGEFEESEEIAGKLNMFGTKSRRSDGVVQVSHLVGCNVSYRKKAFFEAGMADERFTGTGWFEDIDLAVRVEHAGYVLLMDPRIRLRHLALQTGGCGNRQTANEDRKQEDRCRLYLFYCLKNLHVLGARTVLANLWGKYRSYAFNGPLLRSPRKMVARHWGFVRSLARALHLCRQESVCA